jgi:phospholipase C
VEVTIGAGSNGKPQQPTFNNLSTGEGSTSMGFYNVQQGDAPYLKMLADNYAMSDNYHQAGLGGTGLNHILLGFGDDIYFSDSKGNPATPPHMELAGAGSTHAGIVDEIENPNQQAGTNNWYTEDGYGSGGSKSTPAAGGGSYSNCADPNAPGASEVVSYLKSLPYKVDPKCAPGAYYLLNNYNPGYFGNGANAYTDNNYNNTVFTIRPTTVRGIGDALLNISS